MKTVTGRVISSKPISLSKAASTLSSFLSTDNGASPALSAYLRRASASFNELKHLHKELRSSRPDRKHRHHGSEVFRDLEAAVDKPYRSEASHELSHRIGGSGMKNSSASESKNGKKPVDGKRNKDEKTTIGEDEDKPSKRVEMDVESSDIVKRTVAVENRRKKHKKKSEEEHGKIGDDECDAGARQSYGKSRIGDNNGEIEAAREKDRKKHEDKNNDDGRDLTELPIKKKKKKREEDAGNLQNNNGGAIEKDGIPVLNSKELKRKEKKKRKNCDFEEGGDDGSEEQQNTKRRKGNL